MPTVILIISDYLTEVFPITKITNDKTARTIVKMWYIWVGKSLINNIWYLMPSEFNSVKPSAVVCDIKICKYVNSPFHNQL